VGHNLSALTGLRHVQEAGATFACGRDAIRTIRDPSFTIFPTGSHTDNNHVDKSWRVELVYKRGHWGRTGFGLGRIPIDRSCEIISPLLFAGVEEVEMGVLVLTAKRSGSRTRPTRNCG